MERQIVGAAVGAVVSIFFNPLAAEAARLGKEAVARLLGVDDEIEKLSSTLRSIEATLKFAEQNELTFRLKDVAYDADDVLDEFAVELAVSPAVAAGGAAAAAAAAPKGAGSHRHPSRPHHQPAPGFFPIRAVRRGLLAAVQGARLRERKPDALRKLELRGRRIVKKLGGVPLAIRLVAGFLAESFEETRWSTLDSIDFIVSNNILPVLSLSYEYLPRSRKPCFAYCSVFPKGFVFDKSRLIQMWTAQIFFDDLHFRSFGRNEDGSYQMHDLMHDLALSVSSKEFRRLMEEDGDEWSLGMNGAPFSFSNNREEVTWEQFHGFYKARSLLYLHDSSRSTFGRVPGDLFDRLRFIRVLCLAYSDMEELPESIAKLKHLRYLDLSFTRIGCLRIVQPWPSMFLVELPRGMNKLINLRHLDVNQDVVANIPGIGSLSFLQELKVFRVRKEHRYRISELRDLTKLEEGLCIKELQNVDSETTAAQAELHRKTRLKILQMEWTEILKGLEPPRSLERLSISNNAGSVFPPWMCARSYSILSYISLRGCKNWASLPPLGQFSSLKDLKIMMMERVTLVGREFHGNDEVVFPALESLEIGDMANWTQWESDTRKIFPTLRTLMIFSCPKLEGLPQLPASLVDLFLQNVGLRTLPEISSSPDLRDMMTCSLRKMVITSCPNLRSVPGRLLRHLVSLEVHDCENLASMGLDLQYLDCLMHLTVTCCPNLIPETSSSRSIGCPFPELAEHEPQSPPPPPSSSAAHPPLQTLATDNKSVLEHLLPQNLSYLQRLIIIGPCHIPTELRDLPSLLSLSLWLPPTPQPSGSPAAAARPFTVDEAGRERMPGDPVPAGGGLPASMKMLIIRKCPALKERYERGGPDRPAIAYVPQIII
ncbi:unnamed protein product [Spirodela intermedia]|uniref:Uncharacterized protein n=1 Tax=Spirodela intermedia TaxID=51605 RepID=A0A7I8IHN9_SPIIN|nr:unnamed protein product [Spirodela intermedia]CAA6657246.1 unnamed protein product [Spirodela intermedia]